LGGGASLGFGAIQIVQPEIRADTCTGAVRLRRACSFHYSGNAAGATYAGELVGAVVAAGIGQALVVS